MSLPKLIVVDDEVGLADFVCDVAEMAGFETEQFNDAAKFKEQYDKCADVLILDLMMPGVDGIEVIRYLAEINCNAQLILVSGFDQSVLYSAQKLAIERGLNFVGSLGKPFRQKELLAIKWGQNTLISNRLHNIVDSCGFFNSWTAFKSFSCLSVQHKFNLIFKIITP